jgi:predicted DNA-binding transcriptional regulator YafY
MRDELRAALLKISAALPEASRFDDERIQRFFHFDQAWWQQSNAWVPHLQKVQQALWEERKLEIHYRLPQPLEIRQRVSPYGLVVKAGRWYLVCEKNGSVFVYRLSELLDVQLLEERFTHPDDFDLAGYWSQWCRKYEGFLTGFNVTLEVAPRMIPLLPQAFGRQVGEQLSDGDGKDAEGWRRIEVTFESFEAAREKILGYGGGVRVVAPQALRLSVQDYAAQTLKLYQADRN